jgi:hypothetical protein
VNLIQNNIPIQVKSSDDIGRHVIDKEGLENIEIIKLKVNGKFQIDKV